MSRTTKYVIGGVAAVLLIWILPFSGWLTLLLVLAVVAAPVVGYLMLDPSQRRRISRTRKRGQLGR